jgi:hypothetical protein
MAGYKAYTEIKTLINNEELSVNEKVDEAFKKIA